MDPEPGHPPGAGSGEVRLQEGGPPPSHPRLRHRRQTQCSTQGHAYPHCHGLFEKDDASIARYRPDETIDKSYGEHEQGYTHDACRSPAAVFTECAQFRARLSARPRKRVVGPPRKRLSRELFTYWRGRGGLCPPGPPGVVRLSRELFTYWRGRGGGSAPPDPPGVVRLSRELFTYWRGRGGSAPPDPPGVVRL